MSALGPLMFVVVRYLHFFEILKSVGVSRQSRALPPRTSAVDFLKAAVHWVRVNALSAESSPKLTWDAMGLRADSARRLSVRAEPLTR